MRGLMVSDHKEALRVAVDKERKDLLELVRHELEKHVEELQHSRLSDKDILWGKVQMADRIKHLVEARIGIHE